MPRLTQSKTSRGVLEAQIDGENGAAVVCVVPGGPVAITLGAGGKVVTVQFSGVAASELSGLLMAAALRTKG